MFPPAHRIPIVIAAYRKEFVELAGQKADGYLARPAESIPSLRGILERLRAAATAAGRDPGSVETAGYLLSLVDRTRREALNRAKREPFVIYMMSVLSDVSLKRAGFDPELRNRISAAWRAEDYTLAGNLIPDELLDAYMLCGTREDVAAKALAFTVETGLQLPLLQPVLQEERQVEELIEAASFYAELPASARWVASAARRGGGTRRRSTVADGPSPAPGRLADDRRLGPLEATRRRLGATWEILRPFAYTASVIPVLAGAALAAVDGLFEASPFLAALAGAVLLHSGTNIVNEIYDVRQGIDTIVSPRASHAIVKGRMTERAAFTVAGLAFLLAIAVGVYLIAYRGPAIVVLGVLGLVGGWGYTAPPLQYKYRALGVPLVFLLMGPLMVVGSYFAVTGLWSPVALILSVPVGLLVAAILHGNEWRDISEDTRAGIVTLSSRIGRDWAHYGYVGLVLGRLHHARPVGRLLAAAAADAPRDRLAPLPRPGGPVGRAGRHGPGPCDRDDRPADRSTAPRVRGAAGHRAPARRGPAWLTPETPRGGGPRRLERRPPASSRSPSASRAAGTAFGATFRGPRDRFWTRMTWTGASLGGLALALSGRSRAARLRWWHVPLGLLSATILYVDLPGRRPVRPPIRPEGGRSRSDEIYALRSPPAAAGDRRPAGDRHRAGRRALLARPRPGGADAPVRTLARRGPRRRRRTAESTWRRGTSRSSGRPASRARTGARCTRPACRLGALVVSHVAWDVWIFLDPADRRRSRSSRHPDHGRRRKMQPISCPAC